MTIYLRRHAHLKYIHYSGLFLIYQKCYCHSFDKNFISGIPKLNFQSYPTISHWDIYNHPMAQRALDNKILEI
jgi:hypothetical protein